MSIMCIHSEIWGKGGRHWTGRWGEQHNSHRQPIRAEPIRAQQASDQPGEGGDSLRGAHNAGRNIRPKNWIPLTWDTHGLTLRKSIFYHVYLCLARQIMYKRMNYEQMRLKKKKKRVNQYLYLLIMIKKWILLCHYESWLFHGCEHACLSSLSQKY